MAANYADWYALPANDAFQGDYAAVFNLFDGAHAAPPPAELLTHVSTGNDGKYAFVLLGLNARIYVAHRLARFRDIAGAAHAQNDAVLATLGDVNRVGADTIVFAGTLLHRTAVLPNTRTAESIDAAILADPNTLQVDEMDPADPDADIAAARSRPAMLIPPHLVGHVLAATQAPGGLTPRALWTQIARPLLDDAVKGAMCTPFIDWCRVAYSGGVGAANPVAVAIPANLRLDDHALESARWDILSRDLPARAGPAPAPPLNMVGIVAELGGMRADAAIRAQEATQRAAQQAAASILPSKRWGASVSTLLAICQVDDENGLPDVWLEMAKTTVKIDCTTVQTFLNRDIPGLGPSSRSYASATCSSELAKKIGSLALQSSGMDDLDAPLSIFCVSYPTQHSTYETSKAAGHYSQLVQSAAGLTLIDSVTLTASQEFLLPVNLMQVKRVSWAYHRLLAVLLGTEHVVTVAFGAFVGALDERENTLSDIFSNVFVCSSLLRFVQLRMQKWAQRQLSNPLNHVPAPDFAVVFDEIDEQRWIPPSLPPKYTARYDTATQAPVSAAAPVVALPAAAVAPQGTAAPLAGSFNVKNEFLDRERVPVQRHFATKRHRDAHGPPPANSKGREMCLLFHVRASCFHECPRAQDHYRHSPEESLRLAAYLALGKPAATPEAN
jgi:hypothetical protein